MMVQPGMDTSTLAPPPPPIPTPEHNKPACGTNQQTKTINTKAHTLSMQPLNVLAFGWSFNRLASIQGFIAPSNPPSNQISVCPPCAWFPYLRRYTANKNKSEWNKLDKKMDKTTREVGSLIGLDRSYITTSGEVLPKVCH
jgi:hypothetical protein